MTCNYILLRCYIRTINTQFLCTTICKYLKLMIRERNPCGFCSLRQNIGSTCITSKPRFAGLGNFIISLKKIKLSLFISRDHVNRSPLRSRISLFLYLVQKKKKINKIHLHLTNTCILPLTPVYC